MKTLFSTNIKCTKTSSLVQDFQVGHSLVFILKESRVQQKQSIAKSCFCYRGYKYVVKWSAVTVYDEISAMPGVFPILIGIACIFLPINIH